MDVADGLAAIRAGVEDHPVPLGDAFPRRYLLSLLDDLGQQAVARGGQLSQVGVMLPRDHQHVHRRLRIDVTESDSSRATGHNRGGNIPGGDAAEQAVRHVEDLNVWPLQAAADIYGCTTANPRCTTPLVQRSRQFFWHSPSPRVAQRGCAAQL